MHRGTVLGDGNKRPVPKNSPVMHCQRRYNQASCAIPKWLIHQNTRQNRTKSIVVTYINFLMSILYDVLRRSELCKILTQNVGNSISAT